MQTPATPAADALLARIAERQSRIGIIGMGYVGLPLAVAAFDGGFAVTGFDVDRGKVEMLNSARSPITRVPDEKLGEMVGQARFRASSDFAELTHCDVILICVPTPLNRHREPDLTFIVETTATIAQNLREGQLIALESTTYPGTTRDVMRPILERDGHKSGRDFFLGYSPEREDPGNPDFHTASIPKVVGGDGGDAQILVDAFYSAIVERTVPVSSCEVAEAVKLTENIFRSVNIALVNELKLIYDRMGIDVWEVIAAAQTKPFGYMAFYPGPGLGGHCIPIDPFYLTWKAREYSVPTRFIELAGEVNTQAPFHVVDKLVSALSEHRRKALNGSRILMLGIAYKKNVEDTRESPAFVLIEEIERRGGIVEFHDPHVPVVPPLREHPEMAGRVGVALAPDSLAGFDAVVVCTDHDAVDYDLVAAHAQLIVDTRNVMRGRAVSNLVMA